MSNPLGESDPEFNQTASTFTAWIAGNFASVGLTSAQNDAIQAAFADWNIKYPAHNDAQQDAAVKSQEKDTSRAELEALLREVARRIKDNATRLAAGLNEHADRRARVPAPTSRPVLQVDTRERFRHLIEFRDESGSRGKPDGVRHVEIWCFIGPNPPTGPQDCVFLSTDTNTPYMNQIAPEHAGKMIHYIARWVNSRNEHGPWSETVSATVPG